MFPQNIKTLLSNSKNSEHLKYFVNVYCVMTNHLGDQDTRVNHKLITVATYSLLSYLTSNWLLLLNTITFPKYFWHSQFSEFDSKYKT